jgi:hypothetical protein
VVMTPAGLGPENDFAGEDHQQLQIYRPSRHRGCYIRTTIGSIIIVGRESQGAWREDELTSGKPSVLK